MNNDNNTIEVDKEQWEQIMAENKLVLYHEAGHAVVMHKLGYNIESIQAHYEYDDDEATSNPRIKPAGHFHNTTDKLMILMAGRISEKLSDYSEFTMTTPLKVDAGSDYREIQTLTEFWTSEELTELRRQTMNLISSEDTTRAIGDLVQVLDGYQTVEELMDGPTAHRIIKNALEDNADRKPFLAELTELTGEDT